MEHHMYDKNICTRETTFTGGCPEPSGNTSSRRPLGDGQFHPRRLRRRGAGTTRRSAAVSVGLRRLVTPFQRVIPTFSHLDVRMRTSATRSIEAGCIRCVLRSCLHASGAGWSNEMNRHRSGMLCHFFQTNLWGLKTMLSEGFSCAVIVCSVEIDVVECSGWQPYSRR